MQCEIHELDMVWMETEEGGYWQCDDCTDWLIDQGLIGPKENPPHLSVPPQG